MLTSTTPYTKQLDNGLVLKSVADERDVDRLAAFHRHNFGGDVADLIKAMIRHLVMDHPHTRPEHWPFIEDTNTGEIVSALCFIPWTWRYEDVELKSGEMGIVGTLKDYRHRGLIRALVQRHKELLADGEYDLSHIQGIPYFYRQFGYEYALPLEGGWKVELNEIPDDLPEIEQFSFRQASADDIPALMRLYNEATQTLSISTVRDEAIWRYLLGPSMKTDTVAETWLVVDKDSQQVVGYWRITLYGFGKGVNISEGSRLSHAAVMAVLSHSKTLANERSKPFIRLNIPRNHDLVRTARGWGARDLGTYAWQMHIPDVARLLRKLTPIFERRVAESAFAGLSRTVVIDLYREGFELCFESGRLTSVNAVGFKDGGDLRIPPNAFTPLVLGYRSREELGQAYPDLSCWGQMQYLIDTLFPKVESFIYTQY